MILLYRVLKPVAQKLGPIQALILKDEGFKMNCFRQKAFNFENLRLSYWST